VSAATEQVDRPTGVKRLGIELSMSVTASNHRLHPAYRAGQMARETGLYLVVHQEHRTDHEAIVIRGEELPHCRTCKDAVQFYLERQVSHIMHDWDFSGPSFKLVKE